MDDILYIVKSELRKADAAATDQILNELLGERPPEASRQEALSANISCVLDRYSMLSFNETGLDRLLCNVCLLRETASLCMDLDQKIESAVGVNGSAEDLRLCPSSLRTP